MSDKRVSIDADVLIVGGGVVGCAIARRLSLCNLDIVVVEKRHDVACACSSANSGLTGSGWSLPHGSIESKLTVSSNPRWDEIADQLCLQYNRCGSIVLARSQEEAEKIPGMIAEAKSNGVESREIDAAEVRRLAPTATEETVSGMLIPCEGVIDTPGVTFGYADLAALNGVRFFFNEPAVGAKRDGERVREVYTPHLRISPRYVVNAAGLGADVVSRVMGCEEFEMTARRGEYLVFDREVGKQVTKILQMMPTPASHGLMVIPTAHGGLLLGPTAIDIDEKSDTGTHREVLESILEVARGMMPDLDEGSVIKTYAGNRPHSEDGLYRIGQSELATNVLQCAAVRSIGVSCSPALSEYVFELLTEMGLRASVRCDAKERLDHPRRLLEDLDCEKAADDPLGQMIVCACEKVTAADIHAACQAPVPATSIAGIARRTHATYGRCQGGTCGAGVAFIASMYRDGAAWEVPVGEPEATYGVGKADHE